MLLATKAYAIINSEGTFCHVCFSEEGLIDFDKRHPDGTAKPYKMVNCAIVFDNEDKAIQTALAQVEKG